METIDKLINEGYKLCATLPFAANETGKEVRQILMYAKGSLAVFYDMNANKIVYDERNTLMAKG